MTSTKGHADVCVFLSRGGAAQRLQAKVFQRLPSYTESDPRYPRRYSCAFDHGPGIRLLPKGPCGLRARALPLAPLYEFSCDCVSVVRAGWVRLFGRPETTFTRLRLV